MSSRGALPPTPPMQADSTFDGRQSPSVASNSGYSVVSVPSCYFNAAPAINNLEPHAQRQHIPTLPRRVSGPATPLTYNQSPFNGSQYTASPSQHSMSSYYSSPMPTAPPQPQISGLYYQRPLPQVCFPSSLPAAVEANHEAAIPTYDHARISHAHSIGGEPLATSSLHLPIIRCRLSAIAGSIHMSHVQQGLLASVQFEDSLSQPHGREAIQVPSPRMRQGLQRAE
jgi:hypothetical protein